MLQKTIKLTTTAIALWSGIWLLLSALLEWWHRGFVVHYVNTRWVWLVFAATGAVYLIFKTKDPQA
ncbi:hypothetical protein A3H75_00645 [Candidatus Uhrbacteria bacterium RIFCSPLOWO2_02_FULL_51_9]|uniref:DUF5652 domain-containing protein n=1 Tax=Candidatus Uhrbacteria bacterium RIFCSPLOWO2_02_FULL_51_9 TaxID=1802410 RepID=A0A1F7VDY8_9BACT|nr:MAG: hypothetical protein A3H75_00645 [Candidatus Uhrbacteria bacterium RIFCSPLOWO2_02_FULL_51_9]